VQAAYEDKNIGGEFQLNKRLNTLITYVFITMMFSGGMPLLYLISAVYCGATYWVDKYLLVTFYKKPPNLNSKLAKSELRWFKWALLIHFIVTWKMYTRNSILSTDAETMNDSNRNPGYHYGIFVIFTFVFWGLWRYAIRYCVARCRESCGHKKGLKSEYIHQDFYTECSFSTLVGIWKTTNDACERMADNSLFTG